MDLRLNYLSHVDGLRAVAVLLVVAFHSEVPMVPGGFVGVDVFFVISGFLISRLLWKELELTGTVDLQAFYTRRVRRIFPALAVTLLLTLAVGAVVLAQERLRSLTSEVLASVVSLSNIYFWRSADYFDLEGTTKPLLHTWSLGIEEQFYLIWPLALLGLWHRRGLGPPALAIAAVIALSVGLNELALSGPASDVAWLDNPSAAIFYLLPFRAFELAIGSALAMLGDMVLPAPVREGTLVIGVSAIALSVLSFDASTVFPSWPALLPCLGTALVIATGADARLGAFLAWRPLVALGRRSYSLYLIHWPVVVFWRYAVGPLDLYGQIVVGIASMTLAGIMYRWVETPGRFHPLGARFAVAGLLAAALASLVLQNTGTLPNHGTAAFVGASDGGDFHRRNYGGEGYTAGPVDSSRPTRVLLLGDSHGRHYAEGLFTEIIAPRNLGLTILAGPSCYCLPGLVRITPDNDWGSTVAALLRDVRRITQESDQLLVVISHNWLSQLQRSRLTGPDGYPLAKTLTVTDMLSSLRQFQRDLGHAELAVIGQVPMTAGLNIYTELSKPDISRKFSPNELRELPLDPKVRQMNHALAEHARVHGYTFLNPEAVLCEGSRCRTMSEGGELYYSDETHLSKLGSRYVISHFAQKLNELTSDAEPTTGRPILRGTDVSPPGAVIR